MRSAVSTRRCARATPRATRSCAPPRRSCSPTATSSTASTWGSRSTSEPRPMRPCMDFDVNDLDSDPALREAELARLRRDDPVHWDAKNGFWLLTKYADVRAASKDPELFSSQ